MEEKSSSSVLSNIIWKLLERFGAQGVTLVVSIILARLLNPQVYGTIAIVTVFTSILQVFIDSGLGVALIQKKDADDIDFSTVFFFNVFICLIIYILLFFISPLIAGIYNVDNLTSIIRVSGLVLIISGFKNVINAYISKKLLFKKYFFATLGGTISAAIIGIMMAYMGYGVWALVAQNLVNQTIDCIILWSTIDWKPRLLFSFSRLSSLFNYGVKIFFSGLLDVIWNKMRQLIIGKKYTQDDLAFYDRGNSIPLMFTDSLTSSIDSVLLPNMSVIQNDVQSVKQMTKQAIKIGSFVLWPMMIGLAACSDNLIPILLTDEWVMVVPYLRIFCITYAFYPIHTANLNAIKALGRSDIFLKLEIIKKIIGLIIIVISMNYGTYYIALGCIVNSIISQIINSYPNKKLLHYSYLDQIRDISPSLLLSFAMGAVVYSVNYFQLTHASLLILQVILGVSFYFFACIIFKIDSFKYCMNQIKSLVLSVTNNNKMRDN